MRIIDAGDFEAECLVEESECDWDATR